MCNKVIQDLLSAPGMNNYQDEEGLTPLLAASICGNAAVVKQLIAARCYIDVQTTAGGTPIYYAAQNGHVAVIKQLLAARCNVDLQVGLCLDRIRWLRMRSGRVARFG